MMRARQGWAAAAVGGLLLLATGARAQGVDRIWGTVTTVAGERHEGFLRWDRNEASWADFLDGERDRDAELQDRVAEWFGDELPTGRAVEFMGVRISWDDDGPPPGAVEAGVRFGHLEWLQPTSDGSARIGLKGGEEFELRGGSTDLGSDLRGIVVDRPGGGDVDLAWNDVDRIDFGAAPSSARPSADRLYGTVVDRWGDRWTGLISWDRDEALGSDVLDGEDPDGRDRELRFETVAEIAPRFEGGARVLQRNGREWILDGTNDVDDGHRGVQVSDPALGEIVIAWDDVDIVRFSTPPAVGGYDEFDGGRELTGTVETEDGARLTGRIIWDADEARSWNVLNGWSRDVEFRIEFEHVARIERASSRRARVILRDGRELELDGSNDVNDENRGIVIETDDGSWEVVDWDGFVSVDFGGT